MTALAADPVARLHQTGAGHPENPERFDAVMAALEDLNLPLLAARAATEDDIRLVHTADYVRTVRMETAAGMRELSTGDTAIHNDSFQAALHAAGAVLNAVNAVLEGRVRNAFCAVRPPGHHATPTRGMGFCVFNNVAIGARYAQRRYGVSRVLIADWDVHHGNGTQEVFYSDPSVFFFSTHQSPWYPGTGLASETGEGPGAGFNMNCPFPPGAGGREIVGAFRDRLVPAALRFDPQLVLISAGFDSRMGDPLGRFLLTDQDFAALTRLVGRFADGRMVSVLEGGYHPAGLSSAVRVHVETLARLYAVKEGEQPWIRTAGDS